MVPIRFGVDIFSELDKLLEVEIEPAVTRPVLEEINLLQRESKYSFNRELEFALKMVERCNVIEDELRPGEKVDDSLIRIAVDKEYLVATNDANLRHRLRTLGVTVIYLRQSNRLSIDGVVN